MIIAIDPGPTQSALVLYDPRVGLEAHCLEPNHAILERLRNYPAHAADVLVIERIASMGMAVGDSVFETVRWAGRFEQEWVRRELAFARLKRMDVKLHLCGQARAKDGNVRQALIDRFGGPDCTKKGGALYKVTADRWAALAVAVTWADTRAAAQNP